MRRSQCFFEGFVEQMKVDRNDKAAGGDAESDLGGKSGKSNDAGNHEQKPIAVRNKFKDALLGFHT